MIRRAETLTMTVVLVAMCCNPALGQAPAATLKIEIQNIVEYQVDSSDISKIGTNPNITPGDITLSKCLGVPIIGLGHIVAVNGQPAKGTYVSRGTALCVTSTPMPSQPIADTFWRSIRYETYEILQSDGVTPVGTLMVAGLFSGNPAAPGPAVGMQDVAIRLTISP